MTGKEKRRSLLIGLATALLVSQAIYSPARRLLFSGRGAAADSDVLQDHVGVFGHSESLQNELRNHHVIGYAAPERVDTNLGRITELRYYVAQFALAPILIAPHPGYPVVLADFWRPEQLQRFLAEAPWHTLVPIDSSRALVAAKAD